MLFRSIKQKFFFSSNLNISNKKIKNGETALHIACRENLLTVIQTMCALGCRVDIKNKLQMTPLHSNFKKYTNFY